MAKRLIGILLLFLIISPIIGGQDSSEEYLTPGKNLIVEGVPPIPKSYAKLYYEYYRYAYVKLKGWDPVKRELWVQGGTQLVYSMPAPGVNGKIVAPIKFPRIGNYEYYFDRQGKNVIYSLDIDGKELPQLYYWDAETQKSTKLTEDGSRNVEPVWSRNGEWVVWGSTPPGGTGQDLYIMNPRKPESLKLLVKSSNRPIQAFDWSPDDRSIVCIEYIARKAESKILIIDRSTGERQLIFPASATVKAFSIMPAFSPSANKLLFLTDYQSEFIKLVALDLTTKKVTNLIHTIWDIESFALSPDGDLAAYVSNEDGLSKLYILDVKSARVVKKIEHGEGVISELTWHNNSRHLAFNLQSVSTPGDIFVLNIENFNLTCWVHPYDGRNMHSTSITPKIIKWSSFDKLTISGFIYRPKLKHNSPLPVLIEIHGGPEDQARPEFNIDDCIYVNELGIVKINPNIRGSTGYGKTFASLDNGAKRLDALKDIGALLDWINTQPDLDSTRVMVTGFSYGSYMSLLIASTYGSRIRGAICDSGPSNLATFLETTSGWRRDLRRAEYGDERYPKTRRTLERSSPRNHANKIKKPVLIIFGLNDPRSTPSESLAMIKEMKKNNVVVWSVIGKNEGHEFTYIDNRIILLGATSLFIKRYLL